MLAFAPSAMGEQGPVHSPSGPSPWGDLAQQLHDLITGEAAEAWDEIDLPIEPALEWLEGASLRLAQSRTALDHEGRTLHRSLLLKYRRQRIMAYNYEVRAFEEISLELKMRLESLLGRSAAQGKRDLAHRFAKVRSRLNEDPQPTILPVPKTVLRLAFDTCGSMGEAAEAALQCLRKTAGMGSQHRDSPPRSAPSKPRHLNPP